MKLKQLLEQYPEVKEEMDTLSSLSNCVIRQQNEYIEKLEYMIENNKSREDMLKLIDEMHQWTVRLRIDGVLDDNTEWWETL